MSGILNIADPIDLKKDDKEYYDLDDIITDS